MPKKKKTKSPPINKINIELENNNRRARRDICMGNVRGSKKASIFSIFS
jgi:hypothetical protein